MNLFFCRWANNSQPFPLLSGKPRYFRVNQSSFRLFSACGARPETYPPLSQRIRDEILNLTTDTLAASLIVRNIPDTTVFEITEASDRPQVAAKIAKFLAQRHIQNSKDSRLGHMQSAARWLEVQGREA